MNIKALFPTAAIRLMAAVVFFITLNASSQNMKTPDFVYPATVVKNAKAVIENQSSGNDLAKMSAAIQLVIGSDLISTDNAPGNASLLDSLAVASKLPFSSLYYLLEANLYQDIYYSNQGTFDGRTIPADSWPENPEEWSRLQFQQKCMELVGKANADADKLANIPLSDIKSLLTNAEDAIKAGMSVADFVSLGSIRLLNTFTNGLGSYVIPFGSVAAKPALQSPAGLSDAILNDFIARAERSGNSAVLTVAVLKKGEMMPIEVRSDYYYGWIKQHLDSNQIAPLINALYESNYSGVEEQNGKSSSFPSYKEFYNLMNDYARRFPNAPYIKSVANDVKVMSMKSASVNMKGDFTPANEIQGSVKVANVSKVYVNLYSAPRGVSTDGGYEPPQLRANSKLIDSIVLDIDGVVPFSGSADFSFPAQKPGKYFITATTTTPATAAKAKNYYNNVCLFSVCDICMLTSTSSADVSANRIYVVSSANQQPIAGATLDFYKWKRGERVKVSSMPTNAEGYVNAPKGDYYVVAHYGGSEASTQYNGYEYSPNTSSRLSATILTDLAICKPGSEIEWSAVVYNASSKEVTLAKDCSLTAVLRNANNQTVDTLAVTTDADGRVAGKFAIPKQGLLGRYNIALRNPHGKWLDARASFEVADYKTPTFHTKLTATAEEFKPGDVIRFEGKASTYSGMPVAGGKVAYKVSTYSPWWCFWRSVNATYGGETVTDAEGKFVVELPTQGLKGTPFEHCLYRLTADVTSGAGETQSSEPLDFAVGSAYSISANIPERVLATADSVEFNVKVLNMLGKEVKKPLSFSLINDADKKLVKSGNIDGRCLSLPVAGLPSTRYILKFTLADDPEVNDSTSFVLYRESDRKPPVETPLWVTESEVTVLEGQTTVPLTVGSSYAGSLIFCQVSDEKGMVERKWIPVDDCNLTVEVPFPAGCNYAEARFSGIHDFEISSATVVLKSEASQRKLQVETESFRNKLVPGASETWKFRYTFAGEKAPGVAAMAVMTDKALNAIVPFKWSMHPRSILSFGSPCSLSIPYLYNAGCRFSFSSYPHSYDKPFAEASWNFYGQSLLEPMIYYDFMMTAAPTNMTMAYGTDDSGEAGRVVRSRSMKNAMRQEKSMAAGAMDAVEESAESEADADGVAPVSEVKLRPVEMPLAFFRPMLKADPDGSLEVTFEVPDFNTTWQFQLMGYNESLHTASLVVDAVASRPVMVQTNVPSFLRVGDYATIAATLFNNSEAELLLEGEIEIFDLFTGKTIASHRESAQEVQPSQSRVISIAFHVPDGVEALGVRAYARSGNYRDGEQTPVAVLPSSTPVIESQLFYMPATPSVKEFKLPTYPDNAVVTLKYSGNAVWDCITALPSISKPGSASIFSTLKALYANCISSGLTREYPEIQTVLNDIKSSNIETPVSPLEKDSSLKQFSLTLTPWVNDAASESLRLSQLVNLLDTTESRLAIASLLSTIEKRQNNDGGWGWCPDMPSSVYITSDVLLHFAMLKSMGYLPNAHNPLQLSAKALRYCDRQIVEDYKRYPKHFSYGSLLHYLYTRSFFDEPVSDDFKPIRKKALEEISSSWKDFGIYDKATAAILLWRSDKKPVARNILESLSQFATKSPEKGRWFDNLKSSWSAWPKLITTAQALEAYAEIEPASEMVDGLRQWLILQKQTENWGADTYTAEVVQAILSSGTKWTDMSSMPLIKIDGKEIKNLKAEGIAGSFTIALDAKKVSGKKVKIEKTAAGPAWGGVEAQFVAPIAEVKAEPNEELSIVKSIYKITTDAEGTAAESSPLKVGDRVRVTLTINCKKDMDYVAIADGRPAALRPVDQLSGYRLIENLWGYKEVTGSATNLFISFMPAGTHVITYDCFVDRIGDYTGGIAQAQCLYAPLIVTHSAGLIQEVK